MPYKDRAKQRDYQRIWVRQKRQGSTNKLVNVEPTDIEVVEPFVVSPTVRPFAGPLTKERQTSRKGFNE